jgi:hypothetical protein
MPVELAKIFKDFPQIFAAPRFLNPRDPDINVIV